MPVRLDSDPSSPVAFAFRELYPLDVWCWLQAILWLGISRLDLQNRSITYAQESEMPFYVIPHPLLLLFASLVVTWTLPLWPKFAIMVVSTFALTLGVYELGMRRWTLSRLLFDLKALPHSRRRIGPRRWPRRGTRCAAGTRDWRSDRPRARLAGRCGGDAVRRRNSRAATRRYPSSSCRAMTERGSRSRSGGDAHDPIGCIWLYGVRIKVWPTGRFGMS